MEKSVSLQSVTQWLCVAGVDSQRSKDRNVERQGGRSGETRETETQSDKEKDRGLERLGERLKRQEERTRRTKKAALTPAPAFMPARGPAWPILPGTRKGSLGGGVHGGPAARWLWV